MATGIGGAGCLQLAGTSRDRISPCAGRSRGLIARACLIALGARSRARRFRVAHTVHSSAVMRWFHRGWRLTLVGLVVAVGGARDVYAVTPRRGAPVVADELAAMPGSGIATPLRRQPTLRWSRPTTAAWRHFVETAGGAWSAAWDTATGAPSRIWGSGIAVPGAMASPEIAARAARALLADHLALLAPGSTAADFELVANQLDGKIRSVGFAQRAGGYRVEGGQVSFRFQADRLFVIASEALPHVSFATLRSKLEGPALRERVTAAVRRELGLPEASAAPRGDLVVVPLIADGGVLGYRLCAPVVVDGGAAGRYFAYADAATGAVVAAHLLDAYATATVRYRVVDRYPGRGRMDVPAARAYMTIDGAPATTTADGLVAWPSAGPGALATSTTGELVTVVNRAPGGAAATASLALAPGGTAVWDASSSEADDAQVNVFHNLEVVNQFVRTRLDPGMRGLDDAIPANTNVAQDCNAYFDGTAVNFMRASASCQNTGLVQDVVFHEYGHFVHKAEVIAGVGAVDKAMGEGAADFLAASITNDSGVGRGFTYSDAPLRELDPPDSEAMWPRDVGEVHLTGLIYAGAMWDLRKAAIASMGEAAGIDYTLGIYLATLRRATSIPTAVIEALAADDDDGDLGNGTPHECLIRAAFGRHGLRTAAGAVRAPGAVGSGEASAAVNVELTGLSERCPTEAIERVTVAWSPPRDATVPLAGQVDATPSGPTAFSAAIPVSPGASVAYRVEVAFADGSTLALPDNPGDPAYQLYQGDTVPLYCTSFDRDPLAEGWTTGTANGSPSPWRWGAPTGDALHPAAAFSGAAVLALAPGGSYASSTSSYVSLPAIDVGAYTDVRLQYRRWLTVQDGRFDDARIEANGAPVWRNTASMDGTRDHVDREWRFHDVPLSGWFRGHDLAVSFELRADEQVQLGGWTIDDLCVVANPRSVCGDGVLSPTEECDDGPANADRADACRTYCQRPACGDGIVDRGEQCDGGEQCSPLCTRIAPTMADGGCGAARGASRLPLIAAIAAVLRRRRHRQ